MIFYLLVLLLIIKNKDLWFPEFLPTELIVHRNSKPGLRGGEGVSYATNLDFQPKNYKTYNMSGC